MGVKPKIILHADDFGLNRSFNEGIIRSYQTGYLTSTCLRTNGSAFHEAVCRAKELKELGIGVHLNISEGKSNRQVKKDELLCSDNGSYKLSFVSLWGQSAGSNKKKLLAEVEADFRTQIESVLSSGIKPDHLNSHRHFHSIPAIFALTCKLAHEYKIPFVRLPYEFFSLQNQRFYYLSRINWFLPNLAKYVILNKLAKVNKMSALKYGIKTNDLFIGILHTGDMNTEVVKAALSRIDDNMNIGIIEALLHPCAIVGDKDENYIVSSLREYVINPARTREMRVLAGNEIASLIQEKKFELSNYASISTGRPISKELRTDPRSSPQARYRARVFAVLDETPFFQPQYLHRLIHEGTDFDICGVAIVKLTGGGLLEKYLLRNVFRLGLTQLARLGLKQLLLKSKDYLYPIFKGDCFGSVEKVLQAHNIPYKIVSAEHKRDLCNFMKSFSPDIVLSSCSLIFTESMIKVPKLACINRHSALLPSYGGILPVFRAFQFGEKFTGVSVHHLIKEVDKGGVISQKHIPIFKGDSLDKLYKLCFILSFEATVEAIRRVVENHKYVMKNTGENIESYYSFPTKADWKEFKMRGGRFI